MANLCGVFHGFTACASPQRVAILFGNHEEIVYLGVFSSEKFVLSAFIRIFATTYRQGSDETCRQSFLTALKAGYRHIDTAHVYMDE